MNEYTLVVTSCDRHDLLKRTLESFAKFADVPPTETIIIEDGALDAPEWLLQLEGLGKKTWVTTGGRKGQTFAIDTAYARVQTPLIFHCEDDWEFFRTGFIKESSDILDKHLMISMVSVRGPSNHPEVFDAELGITIRQKDWNNWGGISWNPGLRRLSDYKRIGYFGEHVPYNLKCQELDISILYRQLGYFMASLPAACKHIGSEHKVWDRAVKLFKILVAIKACHKYYLHGQVAHEHQAKHKDAESVNGQIAACRDTWVADLDKLNVDHKFFYGRGGNREPLADEVFLDVPDDYVNLPYKLRAIFRWALAQGYEYIFVCDDDTYVWSDRLLASGFEYHDYVGYDWAWNLSDKDNDNNFASGLGYWVSAKAAKIVATTPEQIANHLFQCADDVWVGHVLREAGIRVEHDARYHPNNANKFIDIGDVPLQHAYIALHACESETIRQLHDRAWMLSDASMSSVAGFTELDKQEITLEQEIANLMGGLQL